MFCLPGGLLGPSNRPIPPAGGPPVPLSTDGGGIFKEPALWCRYSDGILELPLNADIRRYVNRYQVLNIVQVGINRSARAVTPPRCSGEEFVSREEFEGKISCSVDKNSSAVGPK